MKKYYEFPIVELVELSCEDVLTVSMQDVDDYDYIIADDIIFE